MNWIQWYRSGVTLLYKLNVRKDSYELILNPTQDDYERYRVYRKVMNNPNYSK